MHPPTNLSEQLSHNPAQLGNSIFNQVVDAFCWMYTKARETVIATTTAPRENPDENCNELNLFSETAQAYKAFSDLIQPQHIDKKSIVQHILKTQVYPRLGLDLQQKFVVVIYFEAMYGDGDLMAGYKTAKFISEKFPQAEILVPCIFVGADKSGLDVFVNKFHKKFANVKHCVVFNSVNEVLALCENKNLPLLLLDVATPCEYVHSLFSINNFVTYHIQEYGKYNNDRPAAIPPLNQQCSWYISGCGGLSVGMHIDSIPDMVPPTSNDVVFQRFYNSNEKFFFAYIAFPIWKKRGNNKCGPLHPEEGAWPPGPQELHDYSVSPYLKCFVGAITRAKKYNNGEELNIVVICSGIDVADSIQQSVLKELELVIPVSMRNLIKIHYIRRLEHEAFRYLMHRSQPEILVTGDQSLIEALSSGNKIIFYETLAHKVCLVKGLHELSQVVDREKQCLVMFLQEDCTYSYEERGVIDARFQTQESCLARAKMQASRLDLPELSQQFTELSRLIIEHYNIYPWLEGLIKRDLILRNKPELLQYESEAMESIVVDEGLKKIIGILLNLNKQSPLPIQSQAGADMGAPHQTII